MSARRIKRGVRLERWRIVAWYRIYQGLGTRFEFEFRLGRPAPLPPEPIWIPYEGNEAVWPPEEETT